MFKPLSRIVALLLIPCLVADLATASGNFRATPSSITRETFSRDAFLLPQWRFVKPLSSETASRLDRLTPGRRIRTLFVTSVATLLFFAAAELVHAQRIVPFAEASDVESYLDSKERATETFWLHSKEGQPFLLARDLFQTTVDLMHDESFVVRQHPLEPLITIVHGTRAMMGLTVDRFTFFQSLTNDELLDDAGLKMAMRTLGIAGIGGMECDADDLARFFTAVNRSRRIHLNAFEKQLKRVLVTPLSPSNLPWLRRTKHGAYESLIRGAVLILYQGTALRDSSAEHEINHGVVATDLEYDQAVMDLLNELEAEDRALPERLIPFFFPYNFKKPGASFRKEAMAYFRNPQHLINSVEYQAGRYLIYKVPLPNDVQGYFNAKGELNPETRLRVQHLSVRIRDLDRFSRYYRRELKGGA